MLLVIVSTVILLVVIFGLLRFISPEGRLIYAIIVWLALLNWVYSIARWEKKKDRINSHS